MTAAKLATIFASYFLKASATVTPPSHPDRTVSATNVVEYMIMHHNAIFEVRIAPLCCLPFRCGLLIAS